MIFFKDHIRKIMHTFNDVNEFWGIPENDRLSSNQLEEIINSYQSYFEDIFAISNVEMDVVSKSGHYINLETIVKNKDKIVFQIPTRKLRKDDKKYNAFIKVDWKDQADFIHCDTIEELNDSVVEKYKMIKKQELFNKLETIGKYALDTPGSPIRKYKIKKMKISKKHVPYAGGSQFPVDLYFYGSEKERHINVSSTVGDPKSNLSKLYSECFDMLKNYYFNEDNNFFKGESLEIINYRKEEKLN